MCVEIALLQRLSVFLGHPVYALGILLFSVIASTGVGSWASEKFFFGNVRNLLILSSLAVVLIFIMQYVMNQLIGMFMTESIQIKILISIVSILPLGFIMGFFFADGSCPYVNSKRLAKERPVIKPKQSEEYANDAIKSLKETLKNEKD